MAVIHSFKGYRPAEKYVSRVAALPYDVMSSDEAREMAKDNPYSFLHVDKAEIDLEKGINIYDDRVYARAAKNLDDMIQNGIYVQDSDSLYIYMLTMDSRTQTGLVACASIDEYIENKIKKHELTREDKELDRIRHVDACNANTGPIFLTYRCNNEIDSIIEKEKEKKAVYDFVSEDGIGHKVWVIDNSETIKRLKELFKDINSLYIADGHHRNASAVKVGLKRRKENPDYDKNAEFNFYLCVLFPDNQLRIMDYNRIVKDLNGLTEKEFIERVSNNFEITQTEGKYRPEKEHTFGMYINGKWYILKAKNSCSGSVENLDVSILQKYLLEPILGIKDPRTDKRIDFVGGIRGLDELTARVDSGEMSVAFSMYPTTINQLMSVADEGKTMPPKSTWFEPKLRSGIFIHKLS